MEHTHPTEASMTRDEQTTANQHQPVQHTAPKEEGHHATHHASELLDYAASKNAAMTLRAINHKLRQQIIKLLEENKRMNVTDIYVKLRLEQSVASQHLAILRRANIVKTVREGKYIHYALNTDRIAAISKFVKDLNSDMPDNTSSRSTNAAPATENTAA